MLGTTYLTTTWKEIAKKTCEKGLNVPLNYKIFMNSSMNRK
jgi:hypothetical protein